MMSLEQILHEKRATPEDAFHAFDRLDTVSIDFMTGRWRGFEIASGHPFDGLLTLFGWYGKQFIDADRVHPLLFYTRDRKRVFAVDPKFIPLGPGLARLKKLKALAPLGLALLRTRQPAARLCMTEYRGKLTATMVYNDKPIRDSFRKIDDNRLLGVMELITVPQPFFFALCRED